MLSYHHIILSLAGISLFSCNRDQTTSRGGNSTEAVTTDQLSVIMDKAKSISSKTTFLRKDVQEYFPRGEFEKGEFMGMNVFKINEKYSLLLGLVSPDPYSFKLGVATPTAFEERPTGVILEIDPEIPESNVLEKIDKGKPGYCSLFLIDTDGKFLYHSKPE